MPKFGGISVYLGRSPAAKHAKPGENLLLDDDGFLCRQFRESLLKSQQARGMFHSGVDIPELPRVDVRWAWVGQTGGVALWQRQGRTGAASVLLNGVEIDGEHDALRAFFLTHRLPAPEHVWEAISAEPKPLLANLFYDLHSFADPVIATASGALGNSFFALFGTSGE